MKGIKMLGVAIVAAMAVMAFVGAGTASAAETTLCKATENLCQSAWPAETEFTAKSSSVSVKLENLTATTCESTITFKASKQSGEPLNWTANAMTWSNCKGSCKTAATTTLPSGTLEASGSGSGTLLTTGEAELKGCALGLSCKFKLTKAGLKFHGGASGAARLTAYAFVENISPSICGKSGTFIATSEEGTSPYAIVTAKEPGKEAISSPSVFVENRAVTTTPNLCKSTAGPWCGVGQEYPLGTEIKVESPKIAFSGNGGFIPYLCAPSTITFKLDEEATNGLSLNGKITQMSWEHCEACPAVTMKKLPSVSLSATGGGNGSAVTTSETEVERESCGLTGNHCPMTVGKGVSLGFWGGAINSTALVSVTAPVSVGGEQICAKFNTWNANGQKGSEPYVIKSVNGLTTGSIFVR